MSKTTDLLGELRPLLKLLHLDPGVLAGRLERGVLLDLMAQASSAIVDDLERHGLTPEKATDPAAKRHMVRSIMYQSLKACWPLHRGANLAADWIRDRHDDNVLAVVLPQIASTDSLHVAVGLVQRATVEDLL